MCVCFFSLIQIFCNYFKIFRIIKIIILGFINIKFYMHLRIFAIKLFIYYDSLFLKLIFFLYPLVQLKVSKLFSRESNSGPFPYALYLFETMNTLPLELDMMNLFLN